MKKILTLDWPSLYFTICKKQNIQKQTKINKWYNLRLFCILSSWCKKKNHWQLKYVFNHHGWASTTYSYMPTWVNGSYKLADQIANTQSTDTNRGSNETHYHKEINQANGSHILFNSSCYTCYHLGSFLLHSMPNTTWWTAAWANKNIIKVLSGRKKIWIIQDSNKQTSD